MPHVLMQDSISVELGAQEPWSHDAVLYEPLDVEQVLIYDNAACLSVKTFLKMCDLNFAVQMKVNAEYMSPSNRVPFIRTGAFVVAELDPLIAFVANKGKNLTEKLDMSQKSDMRAYMSLVNNGIGLAEIYLSWIHPECYEKVTKPRFGSVFPFPLNLILTYQKRQQMLSKLKILGWKYKTLDEVYDEVEKCLQALSERLGNKTYYFGDSPTELDALVFGHLYVILTTPLPDNRLSSMVSNFENLTSFCQRIDRSYFKSDPPVYTPSFKSGPQVYIPSIVRSNEEKIAGNGAGAASRSNRSSGNGASSNGDFDKLEDLSQI